MALVEDWWVNHVPGLEEVTVRYCKPGKEAAHAEYAFQTFRIPEFLNKPFEPMTGIEAASANVENESSEPWPTAITLFYSNVKMVEEDGYIIRDIHFSCEDITISLDWQFTINPDLNCKLLYESNRIDEMKTDDLLASVEWDMGSLVSVMRNKRFIDGFDYVRKNRRLIENATFN